MVAGGRLSQVEGAGSGEGRGFAGMGLVIAGGAEDRMDENRR